MALSVFRGKGSRFCCIFSPANVFEVEIKRYHLLPFYRSCYVYIQPNPNRVIVKITSPQFLGRLCLLQPPLQVKSVTIRDRGVSAAVN